MCALRGDIFPAPLLVKVLDDEALDGRKWVYYPSDVEKPCEDEVAVEEFYRLFAPKVALHKILCKSKSNQSRARVAKQA